MFSSHKSQRTRKPSRVLPRLEELETRALPSTSYVSTNWSGYFVDNTLNSPASNAFTTVSGSWVVPTIASTDTRHAYSSTWVGLDGANYYRNRFFNSVEQIGTEQDTTFTSAVDGTPQYYAWYEMYPAYPVMIPLDILAGDTISASVTYAGGSAFNLSITDSRSGSFTTTQSMPAFYTAQRSSAEWVMEAPSSNFGVLPLADFSTPVTFSNALANSTGISAFPSGDVGSINMINNSYQTLAATSALSGDGFTVTYTGPTSFGGGGGGGHHHHSLATIVGNSQIAMQNMPAVPAMQTIQLSAPVISVAHANGQTFVNSIVTQNPQPASFPGFLIVAPVATDATVDAPPKENQQGDGAATQKSTSSTTSRLIDVPGGTMSRQALDEFFANPANHEANQVEETPSLVGNTAPVIDAAAGAELSFLLLGAYLGNPVKAKETEDNTKRKVRWL